MEKKIYYCDVCGKKYVSESSIYRIHIEYGCGKRDVCHPCFEKICNFVEQIREENGYNYEITIEE